MANIQKLTAQLSKAISEKDSASIEQVYQKVDDYYHYLQNLDDESTLNPAKLQKWTTFYEVVCWEVTKARKQSTLTEIK